MDTMQEFEQALRGHDWFYAYSDDHRYYTKGQAEWQHISELWKKLKAAGQGDEAQALYTSIAPKRK
jgi:hypothetical protein